MDDKFIRTQVQQERDKHNAALAARFVELREKYPEAKPWTLISQIASEDIGMRTIHLNPNHIRKILINEGVYKCEK